MASEEEYAAAAAYYGSDWSAYHQQQYQGSDAPPGVELPPGVESAAMQAAREQAWDLQAQQYAEENQANGRVEEADRNNGQEPPATLVPQEMNAATSAPADATDPHDVPVQAHVDQEQEGTANGSTDNPSEGVDKPDPQSDYSQFSGYDYAAYAASGGYYNPDAAYQYGDTAYQYAAGQVYDAEYYNAQYAAEAAAAAAPKVIVNPFESLAKEKESKSDGNKPVLRRGGPAKKRIIMPVPKKLSDRQKMKAVPGEPSAASPSSPAKPTVNVEGSKLNVDAQGLAAPSNDLNPAAVATHANSELRNGDPLPTQIASNSSQSTSFVPQLFAEVTAASKTATESNSEDKTLLVNSEALAAVGKPEPDRRSTHVASILQQDNSRKRPPTSDDEPDDTPLSDSDMPTLQRKATKGIDDRSARSALLKDARSTMTSSEVASRDAAAEALAAAQAAAASIMSREGFKGDHRQRFPRRSPTRWRGRGNYRSNRYPRHRSRSASASRSRSRSLSRSPRRSRSRSRERYEMQSRRHGPASPPRTRRRDESVDRQPRALSREPQRERHAQERPTYSSEDEMLRAPTLSPPEEDYNTTRRHEERREVHRDWTHAPPPPPPPPPADHRGHSMHDDRSDRYDRFERGYNLPSSGRFATDMPIAGLAERSRRRSRERAPEAALAEEPPIGHRRHHRSRHEESGPTDRLLDDPDQIGREHRKAGSRSSHKRKHQDAEVDESGKVRDRKSHKHRESRRERDPRETDQPLPLAESRDDLYHRSHDQPEYRYEYDPRYDEPRYSSSREYDERYYEEHRAPYRDEQQRAPREEPRALREDWNRERYEREQLERAQKRGVRETW
ncbi:hypothetical protein HKX48_001894 [Thoreauomyces humboldtii]|nr:hypothetical protein HKX48_001894 [Thoreauomyces humboldtii]